MRARLFEPTGPLPRGRTSLQASAGTGKTWTIASLVVRYVAEGEATLDQLLVVTFTRAATAELRDRIRTRLADARRHLTRVLAGAPGGTGDDVLDHLAVGTPDELRVRRDLVDAALSGFDAATITTIHGFCQQVLAASGYAGDVDGAGTLLDATDDLVRAAVHDVLVTQWADVPADRQGDRPKTSRAVAVARAVLGDLDAVVVPDPDDVTAPEPGRDLARMALAVRDAVEARKRARGVLTFDDLLTRLRASLADPDAGPTVRAALRDRYAIALIDEFQDTDPTQWAILSDVFADRTLVLIGDPKQAIYRFRGADVHAYLAATAAEGTDRATLGTNFRSDARLVEVLNRLFAGTAFGDAAIRHGDVAAHHPDVRLHRPDGVDEVLQVRVVTKALAADPARDLIAGDLAAEVTRLLASGATITTDEGERPVVAGDCAVLVRTNDQAQQVQDALRAVGVHAVVNGVGSVLDGPAARDVRALLEALERPSSPPRVRALALSPLLGWHPDDLAALDDDGHAVLHEQVHRWGRVLREHGVAALLRTIQRETRMGERLLGVEGGERWLTDVEHVAELLHTAAASERLGPSAMLAWLVDAGRRTDEIPPEALARRLESDDHAVQVLTVHRSKGLQFPVVFCPYLMSQGMAPQIPLRHHDRGSGRTVVDLGGTDVGDSRDRVRTEEAGERLRLLYVALTRAEHRLVVWWWPLTASRKAYLDSGLTKVLCNPDGASPRVTVGERAALAGHGKTQLPPAMDAAVARLGPGAAWRPVPDEPSPVAVPAAPAPEGAPTQRVFGREVDLAWRRASYSALTRPRPSPGVQPGTDAATTRADEHDAEITATPAADERAGHRPLPLGSQPAGAAFGTVVHAVLEHVDLAADDLDDRLRAEVGRQARRGGLGLDDPDGLAAGLATAARTPLGPAFDDLRLADVGRRDRLDELEFELTLAGRGRLVSLPAIADLLRTHLPADDPFAGYADHLDSHELGAPVRGHLTGSIDLVVRRSTPDGPRFHVIDHKSNRLYGADDAPSTWHYRRDALVDAMVHGHYPLQALLYQVALHRYLRWRLPDHDPDRDLGAVGYTFLRGMAGPDTPRDGGLRCGVLAWHVPPVLVVALSHLLEEGR